MSLWIALPLALVLAGIVFGLGLLALLLSGVVLTGEVLIVTAFVSGLIGSMITLGIAAQ